MASTTPYLTAVTARRTIYSLTNSSPISDARIEELVQFTIKHCSSTFNCQSARCVVLLRDQHVKLWDMALDGMKRILPSPAVAALEGKVKGLRAGFGTGGRSITVSNQRRINA